MVWWCHVLLWATEFYDYLYPPFHPSVLKYAVPNTNTNTIPTHPYWTMLSCKYKYKHLHILFRLSIHPFCRETYSLSNTLSSESVTFWDHSSSSPSCRWWWQRMSFCSWWWWCWSDGVGEDDGGGGDDVDEDGDFATFSHIFQLVPCLK